MQFINQYIEYKRQELGITRKQLSSGLCYYTVLAKLESDKIYADKLLIDTLLLRLGVEKIHFEHYITATEAYLTELRVKIL